MNNLRQPPYAWALCIPLQLAITCTLLIAAPQQRRQADTAVRPAAPETGKGNTPAAKPPLATAEELSEETTLDALLGIESYAVYAEVRMIGRQMSSNGAAGEILQALKQLQLIPAEMNSFISFITSHAEKLANTSLTVASMPASNQPGLPRIMIAVDFATTEEAREFEPLLRRFFSTLTSLAAQPKKATPTLKSNSARSQKSARESAAPTFHLLRKANLLLLSETDFDLSVLKPKKSAALSEEPRFRALRSRFAAEQFFVYVATGLMERIRKRESERETKLQQKQEAEMNVADAPQAGRIDNQTLELETTVEAATEKTASPVQPSDSPPIAVDETVAQHQSAANDADNDEPPAPATMGPHIELSTLQMLLFDGFMNSDQVRWPEAVGVGVQAEAEMFALRVLLWEGLNSKVGPLPMIPFAEPGPALAMEAPSYAPNNTELLIGGSLDLRRVFDGFVARSAGGVVAAEPDSASSGGGPFDGWIRTLEGKYGFKRDELLSALGSEVAVTMPASSFSTPTADGTGESATDAQRGTVLYVSVKDRSRLKSILPRVMEALGAKGAGEQLLVQISGGADLTVYQNFAVAFADDFLILGGNAADVRRAVDIYQRRQTLGGKKEFADATNWAPAQKLGYAYVSENLMKKLLADTQRAVLRADELTRVFYAGVSKDARPLVYAISAEGSSVLHELRLPQNLVMTLIAAAAAEANKLPLAKNEDAAINELRRVFRAQAAYRENQGQGSYGTLEQLIKARLLSASDAQQQGYRIEINASGTHFQATATPQFYGQTGQFSYFIDETGVVRGGDAGGNRATVTEQPIQ